MHKRPTTRTLPGCFLSLQKQGFRVLQRGLFQVGATKIDLFRGAWKSVVFTDTIHFFLRPTRPFVPMVGNVKTTVIHTAVFKIDQFGVPRVGLQLPWFNEQKW